MQSLKSLGEYGEIWECRPDPHRHSRVEGWLVMLGSICRNIAFLPGRRRHSLFGVYPGKVLGYYVIEVNQLI